MIFAFEVLLFFAFIVLSCLAVVTLVVETLRTRKQRYSFLGGALGSLAFRVALVWYASLNARFWGG